MSTDSTWQGAHAVAADLQQKTGIQIVAGVKVNTGFFKNGAGEMRLQWSATERGRDPSGSSNTKATVAVLCAAGATDPRCG